MKATQIAGFLLLIGSLYFIHTMGEQLYKNNDYNNVRFLSNTPNRILDAEDDYEDADDFEDGMMKGKNKQYKDDHKDDMNCKCKFKPKKGGKYGGKKEMQKFMELNEMTIDEFKEFKLQQMAENGAVSRVLQEQGQKPEGGKPHNFDDDFETNCKCDDDKGQKLMVVKIVCGVLLLILIPLAIWGCVKCYKKRKAAQAKKAKGPSRNIDNLNKSNSDSPENSQVEHERVIANYQTPITNQAAYNPQGDYIGIQEIGVKTANNRNEPEYRRSPSTLTDSGTQSKKNAKVFPDEHSP